MVAFELEGIEIDRCLECGGTWLDAGELEQIVELGGVDPAELERELSAATAEKKTRRRCPRCPRRLREFQVGDASRVVLDRCGAGHGLWFDRGEMETVIRSFSEGAGGAVARFFGDLYHHELEPTDEGESR
jgi:Zn-finger nucleic acid-binding protein